MSLGTTFLSVRGALTHIACVLLTTTLVQGQSASGGGKRPITIGDVIGMTRLAEPAYSLGGSIAGNVAHFSPNRKRFVVVLQSGNVKANTNEFSLLCFDAQAAFRSPKPRVLLRISSSSNRDGIRDVKWLSDNETIAFLGSEGSEHSQVYTLNIRTLQLERRTHHATDIVNYDIPGDGRKLAFTAKSPARNLTDGEKVRRHGLVVTPQQLFELLAPDCSKPTRNAVQLLVADSGKQPVLVKFSDEDEVTEGSLPSFSPDGAHLIVDVSVGRIPALWTGYQNRFIQENVVEGRLRRGPSAIRRFVLLPASGAFTRPVLNTPVLGNAPFAWSADGKSLFLKKMYLPLDLDDPVERSLREREQYSIQVDIFKQQWRKIADADWPKSSLSSKGLEVSLDESVNRPPKLYVRDATSEDRTLLLDLNPQFSQLEFGRVDLIKWRGTDGQDSEGVMYLPPDFRSGVRYPLVIQTHGFQRERFSMDGLNEWSSAFGARLLAAKGIVVLQADMSADSTAEEGPREMARYEGAIDYLDREGIIDRNLVGISGYSRTVLHVGYTLTHSKYRFAAANLVDGIDAGYFNYVLWGHEQYAMLNGGRPVSEGLKLWLKNSPSFNLDKVESPVRLVGLGEGGGLLEQWEWFAQLSNLGKPVEYLFLPTAAHIVVRPWERIATQQGLADWFSFWLKGEEDPNPEKTQQYARWRKMKAHAQQRN